MIQHEFTRIDKPWGYERILALTSHYCLKELFLKAGCRTSLQYHVQKMESIYVVSGEGLVEVGEVGELRTEYAVKTGDGWTVVPLEIHRVKAITDLLYYEASTIELDDVVRVQDDYGRELK